jgi:hypothetical protein
MMGAPQLRPGSPPVRMIVEPMPYEDSNRSTAITIERMCQLIHHSARNPFFGGAAHAIPYRWRGSPAMPAAQFQELDPASRQRVMVATADWWFVKHFIRFVQDQGLVQKLTGLPEALEGLIAPEVMIRCVEPQGDCDDFTMFLCCLCECQGIEWEIVTLACSRRQPRIWSHVFPRAVIGNMRMPLDASHGAYPGWSVPSRDIQRMAVWDRNGQLVTPPQQEVI